MGTRSTVKFYDEYSEEPILSVYQQYDGYISGVGYELAEFLRNKKVVNGFRSGQNMANGYANGMGCLAAQYVAEFKTNIGGFYITSPEDNQEYNYKVRLINGEIQIEVDDFFKGSPEELLNYEEPEDFE